YAYLPLLSVTRTDGGVVRGPAVVEHAASGSLDAAFSPIDRLALSLSLPVSLVQAGQPALGVTPTAGLAARGPRLASLVRLVRLPDEGFALQLGAAVQLPVGRAFGGPAATASLTGDGQARILGRVVVAGVVGGWLRYAVDAGVLYRAEATL